MIVIVIFNKIVSIMTLVIIILYMSLGFIIVYAAIVAKAMRNNPQYRADFKENV